MLSLAAFRYRDVVQEHGGPIAKIQQGHLPVRGQRLCLANAWLQPDLSPAKNVRGLYSNADGSGTDASPTIARHKAISEALERWAFQVVARSERAAEFGFVADPSTNGMSAFPGLRRRHARRAAVLEAVERFCLIAWWEGLARGVPIATDWPGVAAVAIEGPFGGVTVITYARCEWGGYVYGHAAEESIGAATEHAVVELARHELIMRSSWLATVAGNKPVPQHLFERRMLFFATDEGHELFQQRVRASTTRRMPSPEVLCDAPIPGPWDDYATVWRFALRPVADGYLRGGDDYFFL